jgi:hypothetical protein
MSSVLVRKTSVPPFVPRALSWARFARESGGEGMGVSVKAIWGLVCAMREEMGVGKYWSRVEWYTRGAGGGLVMVLRSEEGERELREDENGKGKGVFFEVGG